jgi:hypothetical protein
MKIQCRAGHFIGIFGTLIATTIGISFPANAQTIALTSVRGTGNQIFTGALGMDFDVLSGIEITRLGAFDSGQDGFVNNINVGIFDRNTGTLVAGLSAVLNTGNTVAVGQSRFFDLPNVVLAPGNYSIVAQGFGAADLNGNAGLGGPPPTVDTGGGLIAFVGSGRFTAAPALVYPTVVDTGPANRYDAGTFEFIPATIGTTAPEPGSLALLALTGLPVVGAVIRRRRSA